MKKIKKKQSLNNKFLKKEYFFPSGRAAFLQALKILHLDKKHKILLPSYIGLSQREGSGVLDPIHEGHVGYDFYKLNADLSVNKEDFTKKITRNDVEAVLIIHYFGFYQKNFEYIIETCRKHNTYLIEDCAHAFNSFYKNKRLGTFGDIGFYSLHKFLATNDGGILAINNEKIQIPMNIKDDISKKNLLILHKSNITEISKKRINNYQYLLKEIQSLRGVHPFYSTLPRAVVPINFPVIIEKKDRNHVYFSLLKKGIETVSLYHTLIPQIKKESYPLSHHISQHILNLPIHEDLSRVDIYRMLTELEHILDSS